MDHWVVIICFVHRVSFIHTAVINLDSKPIQASVPVGPDAKMIFLAWSLGVVGAATQVLRLGKVEITCVIWPDATDFINAPSVLTACKPFYPSFKTISLMIQPIPALIISVVSSVMYFKIIRKLHTRKWRKGICKDSHNFNHAAKEERNKVATLLITTTDLKTWMAGSAEKLRQSGRHIGPVKKPS